MPSRPAVRRLLAPVLLGVALAGCAPADADRLDAGPSAPVPPAASAPVATPDASRADLPVRPVGAAAAALATLPVKGRAPRTGYDREVFGPRWSDTDRNGCDTRNDVLRRDLTDPVLKAGTNGCVVLSGTLLDPYSGATLAFERGHDTSRLVQVDHVVALSDAWQKGAQQWSPGRRLAFANDPLNLLAVDGPLNQLKSDGDAATWLPPQTSYRCAYVARQVAVKATYGAWVTQAEHDAIAGLLAACPGEPLPTSDLPTDPDLGAAAPPPSAPVRAAPAAPAAPAPAVPAPTASGAGCDPAYPGTCIPSPAAGGGDLDCGDVPARRFAVVAPDPHRFDGDGDGVGCESDRPGPSLAGKLPG